MNRVHKTPHCHLGLWGYIHMKCFTKKFFNLYFISLLELLVNIPKTTEELFQSLCHQLIRIAGSYPYNHSSQLYTLHPVPYTRYSKLSVCQSVTLLNQSSISTSLLRFSCVGLGTSFWFNISSIEQPKCQMSKLWGLSHCDLSNFNHQMIIIPCKYLVSGTCVILYKMALHKTEISQFTCTHVFEIFIIFLVPLLGKFLPHLFDRSPEVSHEANPIVRSSVLLFPKPIGLLLL